MFSRTLTPVMLLGLMLACSTDLPLEAQRSSHARATASGPIVISGVRGSILDGGTLFGTFEGTVTITSLSRNATGDTVNAAGTLTGTATQDGATTEITQPFTDVYIEFLALSSQCRHFTFYFRDPITSEQLGHNLSLSSTSILISDNSLARDLCALGDLARQAKSGTLSQAELDKMDRLIASINAALQP